MSFLNLNWIKQNFTNDKFVFFEVGCAELDTSCRIRELIPTAEIYAFEPAAYWHIINESIAAKFNIHYFRYAFSDIDGLISFNPSSTQFDDPHPWSGSIFKLEDMPYESHGKKYSDPYEVHSYRLESFCQKFNVSPDVLHVDAEGAEFKIITNMGNFKPKCIWAEVAGFGHYKNGTTMQEFDDELKKLGYTKTYTDQRDALYCLDGIKFTEYTAINNNNDNTMTIDNNAEETITTISKNYKQRQWDSFDVSYLNNFGTDVPVYHPSVYKEYRGEIFTTFHSETHPVMKLLPKDINIHGRFSKSYQGVLRGLHYDKKTWKLVQALVGDIYLVVVDVRKTSPNYGKWESYIISESTRDQVLIPPGFANGHYALTDCIFHYNLFYQGEYVDEKNQGVLKWNDNRVNIEWPTDKPILQARDR